MYLSFSAKKNFINVYTIFHKLIVINLSKNNHCFQIQILPINTTLIVLSVGDERLLLFIPLHCLF